MPKTKKSKQGDKRDNDFEFWNDIAIAVQSVAIKVGEFEEKLNKVEKKLDKVISLVENNPSVEEDITFLKETAQSLVEKETEDKNTEDRKPAASDKPTKKRRYIYR